MLAEPTVLALSLAYLGLLFAVAYFGDRHARAWSASSVAPAVYGLSLAIYCTSWTFYGAVGRASTVGHRLHPDLYRPGAGDRRWAIRCCARWCGWPSSTT